MSVNSFDDYSMSWRPKLKRNEAPLYINLANQLERDIASGDLRPGTKLPPQRELADFLDVNVSTISRAFKLCSRKGLLNGTVGSGTYIAYNISTNIFATPAHSEPHIVDLGSMMPETIPQDEITRLLHKMIEETAFERLFQYSHKADDWQLEAATVLLKKVGCPVPSSQILLANGGQNSLAAILAGLFEPGDRLGVDPLVYPGLKSVATLFNVQLIPIAHKNGEMSEEGLRYAAKNEGIKAIYVMPDCHNPTTHIMSEQCRDRIAEVAKELDILVIEDGINSLLLREPKSSIFARALEQTIFSLSLSKTISPALRLAYLAVPKRYFHTLENALYNINLSQSALLLELASRLIVSGQLDSLLERRREGLAARNHLTDSLLQGYDVFGNSESLCRWLILPEAVSGEQFEQLALDRGLFVYGSERFAVGKNVPVQAVRLAICAPNHSSDLEWALSTIRDLLEHL